MCVYGGGGGLCVLKLSSWSQPVDARLFACMHRLRELTMVSCWREKQKCLGMLRSMELWCQWLIRGWQHQKLVWWGCLL